MFSVSLGPDSTEPFEVSAPFFLCYFTSFFIFRVAMFIAYVLQDHMSPRACYLINKNSGLKDFMIF